MLLREIIKIAKEENLYNIQIPNHDDDNLYMLNLALSKNDFVTVRWLDCIHQNIKIDFDWASKIDHILYYYLAFYCIKYQKSKCYEYILEYHIHSEEELSNIYNYAGKFVTKKYSCTKLVKPTSTLIKIKRLVEMLKTVPKLNSFDPPFVTFRNHKNFFCIYYNDDGKYWIQSPEFIKANLDLCELYEVIENIKDIVNETTTDIWLYRTYDPEDKINGENSSACRKYCLPNYYKK